MGGVSSFVAEQPTFVWIVSSALFAWALRWLRRLIKDEAASIKADVLTAIETRRYATSETVTHSLNEIRQDLVNLGVRLDKHLERCHPPERRR